MIDVLLRSAPHKARSERERQQADEVYKAGQSMRVCAAPYLETFVDQGLYEASRPKRSLTRTEPQPSH